MCGIAGIICRKNFSAELYRESLNLALDKINHRGPDGRGIYIKNNIGLGHVRLSIIDLSDAGSQPMISNDENHVISYNGEVYNFKDLKNELMLKDSDYKSTTDTEIILEYFKRNGISSFNKLNGMFAFCLIDQVREKAYLVRDRFGIKPLYYSSNENNIVFASEMKAIKEISNINQMNEQVLPEWSYFGNALESRTIYKEVHQLLPGHYLEIDTSSLSVKKERYWSPESLNSKKVQSFKDVSKVVRKTQRLLEEAVCNQLVGDVEVGIFLSGGDTVSSNKLSFTITNIGFSKNIIFRNNAKINDDIYVTGNLGDSYIGLKVLKKKINKNKNFKRYFENMYYQPNLCLKLTKKLASFANTSIDISDGLITDLEKLINKQKLSYKLDLNSIPISNNLKKLLNLKKLNKISIISKGDDYQILFTANPSKFRIISKIAKSLGVKISKIGKIFDILYSFISI